jgi:hydroxymethylglutaryl-CoA reductase (NADPH)
LQEEGMSFKNAESVANASNTKSPDSAEYKSPSTTFLNFFGPKIRDSTVTRFKLFMVSSFGTLVPMCRLIPVLLNLLNLCTLPFRPRLGGSPIINQPSDEILALISNNISLTYPDIRYITLTALPPVSFQSTSLLLQSRNVVELFLEGWTRRVGDPVISKWVVITLCVSMGLNAWLLAAVRRGVTQPIVQNKTEEQDKIPPPTVIPPIERVVAPPKFILAESESDEDENRALVNKKLARRHRSVSECLQILSENRADELLDEDLIGLTVQKKIPLYALEKTIKNFERAVQVRRAAVCMFHYRVSLIPSP